MLKYGCFGEDFAAAFAAETAVKWLAGHRVGVGVDCYYGRVGVQAVLLRSRSEGYGDGWESCKGEEYGFEEDAGKVEYGAALSPVQGVRER